MIHTTPPYDLSIETLTTGGPPRRERADVIAPVTRLFRGVIRNLCFAANGRLLVSTDHGVQVLDPDTLEQVDHWLPDVPVRALMPTGGEALVVLTPNGAAIGEVGKPLGSLLAGVDSNATCSTDTSRIAVPTPKGVRLLDHQGDRLAEFSLPERFVTDDAKPNAALLWGGYIGAYDTIGNCGEGTLFVLWDVETGEVVVEQRGRKAARMALPLPDGRLLLGFEPGRYATIASDAIHEPQGMRLAGFPFVGGKRTIVADCWGRHRVVGADLQQVLSSDEGDKFLANLPQQARNVGAMGGPRHPLAAVSASHVAVHSPSLGTLRVCHDSSVHVGHGWLEPIGLSLSRSAMTLAVETSWAQRTVLVDRRAASQRDVFAANTGTGYVELSSPTVTGDDLTGLVAAGDFDSRSLWAISLDDGAVRQGPTLLQRTPHLQGLTDGIYLVATGKYDSAGYVGVYQIGSNKAIRKLTYAKESPRNFVVDRAAATVLIRWSSAITLHELPNGKLLETVKEPLLGDALAIANDGRIAYLQWRKPVDASRRGNDEILIVSRGDKRVEAVLDRVPPPADAWVKRPQTSLCFSEDGSLLFVGRLDGRIEIRDPNTGECLRELPLHVGPCLGIHLGGGLLWTLGADGLLIGLGVPGEQPAAPSPSGNRAAWPTGAIKREVLDALPTTQPFAIVDIVGTAFDLGGRTLTIDRRDDMRVLVDAKGKVAKSLRKRKTDDTAKFEAAKDRWTQMRTADAKVAKRSERLLREGLRTGRSATVAELRAALRHPDALTALTGSIWESLDGTDRGYLDGAEPKTRDGSPWTPVDEARLRPLHPIRLNQQDLESWLSVRPNAAQLGRRLHSAQNVKSYDPAGTKICPVDTDWANTPNAQVEGRLRSMGFLRHELATFANNQAWVLLAPELATVVLADLDAEHGGTVLSFHPWNGTRDGDAAMKLTEVDPQLYSEAFDAIRAAYPYDRRKPAQVDSKPVSKPKPEPEPEPSSKAASEKPKPTPKKKLKLGKLPFALENEAAAEDLIKVVLNASNISPQLQAEVAAHHISKGDVARAILIAEAINFEYAPELAAELSCLFQKHDHGDASRALLKRAHAGRDAAVSRGTPVGATLLAWLAAAEISHGGDEKALDQAVAKLNQDFPPEVRRHVIAVQRRKLTLDVATACIASGAHNHAIQLIEKEHEVVRDRTFLALSVLESGDLQLMQRLMRAATNTALGTPKLGMQRFDLDACVDFLIAADALDEAWEVAELRRFNFRRTMVDRLAVTKGVDVAWAFVTPHLERALGTDRRCAGDILVPLTRHDPEGSAAWVERYFAAQNGVRALARDAIIALNTGQLEDYLEELSAMDPKDESFFFADLLEHVPQDHAQWSQIASKAFIRSTHLAATYGHDSYVDVRDELFDAAQKPEYGTKASALASLAYGTARIGDVAGAQAFRMKVPKAKREQATINLARGAIECGHYSAALAMLGDVDPKIGAAVALRGLVEHVWDGVYRMPRQWYDHQFSKN